MPQSSVYGPLEGGTSGVELGFSEPWRSPHHLWWSGGVGLLAWLSL